MSNHEGEPKSGEETLNAGEEWNMESSWEAGEGDSSEAVDEDNGEYYVSDPEKMGDMRSCTLREPGEELGWSERVNVRQIARAYGERLREKDASVEVLHDRIISTLGRFLDVPGYGYYDEEKTTEAQQRRLEELYQKVVEEEKANRNIFEKIVSDVKARKVFAKVLAVAAAASLAFGVNAAKSGEEGNGDAVAMLEEYRDSLEENPDRVEKTEEVGGMTTDDMDELIKEINQSSVE